MPWSAEEAKAMAVKGGKARAAQRAAELEAQRNADPEMEALEAEAKFRAASSRLSQRLIDAAEGKGVFKALKAGEQLTAIMRALEYGVGKPTALPKEKPRDPEQEEPKGLSVV